MTSAFCIVSCAAEAQTPPQTPAQTPAETLPQTLPQTSGPPASPDGGTGTTTLPAIIVEAPKTRPAVAPAPRTAPASSQAPSDAGTKPVAAPEPGLSTAPAAGIDNVGSGGIVMPSMASQVFVPRDELLARPLTRPGEVLEAAPGLIVTQHSGEGKANQYFLRGYNLDHGTDMAIFVDDVPVNMRTHAHGQGYSDLNWLMPETVQGVEVRKGPYFADEGDFGSVGDLHVGILDKVDKTIGLVTVGSFGYRRLFGMTSAKTGDGNLLLAAEAATYDGPWVNPDDMRKLNGMLRYSQGNALDGFTLTAMAYSNRWSSTDQVPERALSSGFLTRFGSEDPTDGGSTSRYALSARYVSSDDTGSWKANAFVVDSKLDLYNNFTYVLANGDQGDQFHQHDSRTLSGMNVARTQRSALGSIPVETTVGVQTRYDSIDLALTDTYRRSFLSNVRTDKVGEGSIGVYAESTLHWLPWLRTTFGWRGDLYQVSVNSVFDNNNSGHADAALGSPKLRMVLGPFDRTEFFLGAGYGMHSNDARGVTITESPADPATKLDRSPLLVRTKGAEIGVRTKAIDGLDTSLSLFMLDQASEIVFNGDGGDTSASRPSQRYGVEWTGKYRPTRWMTIDGEVAWSHARFVGFDKDQADLYASLAGFPQAQIGNAPGNYIPNAPEIVASAGLTFGDKTGWFGGPRWRYLGSSPLTEDNAFRSSPTSLLNVRAGYNFDNGWTIQFDALNVLNTKANQITYAYGSLIKTDSLYRLCYPVQTAPAAVCQNGVMDRVLHPVEPLAFRLTVVGRF